MKKINPFSVVKATEYTDDEIYKYWVPYSDTHSEIVQMKLRPDELMPKYVLGCKGCGKTHILRYYSYELRKLSHNQDIRKLLSEDKYIGVYSRLDTLSASRFKGKSVSQETWISLYDYYFELYQVLTIIKVYQDIFKLLELPESTENEIINGIADYMQITLNGSSLADMASFLNAKRILIDREIIEYSHSQQLNWDKVKPIFKFGDIIFEIPHRIHSAVPELKDVKLIYILDEYEKLIDDWKKESLNTLVYEKKGNTTFWIGARRYGYTTFKTKVTEPIREGHEFQPIYLDAIIRDKKMFKKFAYDVFTRRLKLAGIDDKVTTEIFETFDENILLDSLRGKKVDLKHWAELRRHLRAIKLPDYEIELIIESLKYKATDEPLHQKYKLFSFYQKWSKNKNDFDINVINESIREVNVEFEEFLSGKKNQFAEKTKKFKLDFMAQLVVENGLKYYMYSGFDEFVNIADYNPRVFLTILKQIIDESLFKGEDPFDHTKKIPVKYQYVGINETATWFRNDIEVTGHDKEILEVMIKNLVNIFYVNRFSNKPTDTSPCSFYFKYKVGISNCEKLIKIAQNESFLIEIENKRKDKTMKTPEISYQLNKTIAILYNLPTARRGIISLNTDVLKSIFDEEHFNEFRKHLVQLNARLNAPFDYKRNKKDVTGETNQGPTLFDNL